MFGRQAQRRTALLATTLALKLCITAAKAVGAAMPPPPPGLETSPAPVLDAGALADDMGLPAPVVQGGVQPPARLHLYPPVPSALALGRVVLRYRTENLIIRPVFGPAALGIAPRIGHLHITVDGGPWRWLDASNEPVVINGLPPGTHQVLVQLVDPTHQTLDEGVVRFVVPPLSPSAHD